MVEIAQKDRRTSSEVRVFMYKTLTNAIKLRTIQKEQQIAYNLI